MNDISLMKIGERMSTQNPKLHIQEGEIARDYIPKTEDEIREIAKGLVNGTYFCDRQIAPQDYSHMVGSVFMPLMFMDDGNAKHMMMNDADMLYSEMAGAFPRSTNGYPMFGAFRWLDKSDTIRVIVKYQAIQKAMEEA